MKRIYFPFFFFLLGILIAFLFLNQHVKNDKRVTAFNEEERVEDQELPVLTNEENELIHVITLSPTTTVASIEYSNQPKHISEWTDEEEGIVVNGAYFLEDYSPAGFLVVENKKVGTTVFDQDKSGLIVIKDGQLSIRDLETSPIQKKEQFEYALQSFPFLIKNSKPALAVDSGKKAQRTAVGIDAKKNVYVLSVVHQQISLYEFMKEIETLKIPFTFVLNLDGGPSTGVYMQWEGEKYFSDSFTGVSSILRWNKK